ncbi:MAG: MBL fold metallo-hydrolase [Candidatus Atribacteria bacterium]|nr:MBL fold metallo-hydrolase [Candidatus Atribacteria bacterium]
MSFPLFTVTILYDNRTIQDDLLPSHGFSCMVENDRGKKVLFDTGESGPLLLANMQRLGIDASTIEKVVLSHEHYDHVGGLISLLANRIDIEIFILPSFSTAFRKKILDLNGDLKEVSEGMEILPGLFSTGEVVGAINEQGLVVVGKEKALFIGGCCHPGLERMVSTASQVAGQPVGGVMGGLHLCQSEDEEIESQLQNLKKLGVDRIAPCHCTGFTGMDMARDIWDSGYFTTGVGMKLEWE